MKKTKIISFLMASIIIVSMFGVSAYAAEPAPEFIKASEEMYLSQDDVFEALAYTFGEQELKDAIATETVLSPTGARIKGFDSEDYSKYTDNEYGGMYLNDSGVLVLCYVEESNTIKSCNR